MRNSIELQVMILILDTALMNIYINGLSEFDFIQV
jgi:hypothetical protein